MTAAIDAGAEDVLAEGDSYEIRCDAADFMNVREQAPGGRHRFLVRRAHHDPQEHGRPGRERRAQDPETARRARKRTTTCKRSSQTSTSPTKSCRPWRVERARRL